MSNQNKNNNSIASHRETGLFYRPRWRQRKMRKDANEINNDEMWFAYIEDAEQKKWMCREKNRIFKQILAHK